ncbi:hypothetical protein GZ77_05360 [Endozoicomonas montiporae]|uniref:Uncharacterized protein n=2 Tax=Endozoicomonas montiporae TaxID=1027273 RepID=A0A081NBV2_9GAMM|nr:hypothetical protein [Endozoicomonas montiporae]AMO56238.1 hypothetical protein EZMO1_2123 [Endozoicomonas montiporae CL-33]KEQ15925.1 hypothetical protein GZ77_05360 [Endozoicomonas montiporae]
MYEFGNFADIEAPQTKRSPPIPETALPAFKNDGDIAFFRQQPKMEGTRQRTTKQLVKFLKQNAELLYSLSEYSKFEWIEVALDKDKNIESHTDKGSATAILKDWKDYTNETTDCHSLYLEVNESPCTEHYHLTLGLVRKGFKSEHLADNLATHFGIKTTKRWKDRTRLFATLSKAEFGNEKLLSTIYKTLDEIAQVVRDCLASE